LGYVLDRLGYIRSLLVSGCKDKWASHIQVARSMGYHKQNLQCLSDFHVRQMKWNLCECRWFFSMSSLYNTTWALKMGLLWNVLHNCFLRLNYFIIDQSGLLNLISLSLLSHLQQFKSFSSNSFSCTNVHFVWSFHDLTHTSGEDLFRKIFECVTPDLNVMEWPCPCPLQWVLCLASMPKCGQVVPSQHNGQQLDHSIVTLRPLRFGQLKVQWALTSLFHLKAHAWSSHGSLKLDRRPTLSKLLNLKPLVDTKKKCSLQNMKCVKCFVKLQDFMLDVHEGC
jgi:hypothetical protein